MPSSTLDRASLEGTRLASLVIGVLAGPIVWAALLEVNYTMSYVACEHRQTWMLYASAIVGLALIGLAALGAGRVEPLRDESTARFLRIFALAFCAFFAFVVLATEIPVVVLHPCSW
jgi:hypothetical protein